MSTTLLQESIDENDPDAFDESGWPANGAPRLLSADEVGELTLSQNKVCADCKAQTGVTWVSLGFGALVCAQCSGSHRAFGTHITFVRSLTLDLWTKTQHDQLAAGGNAALETSRGQLSPAAAAAWYELGDSALYRMQLAAKVSGSEPPTALPADFDVGSLRSHLRKKREAKAWVPDTAASHCQVCQRSFTLLFRKHHCRSCGGVVCRLCAPKNNTRPIPELGHLDPVRHCRRCFCSPTVDWRR